MPPQGALRAALDNLDPNDPRPDAEIIQGWRDAGLIDRRAENFIVKELEKRRLQR